jgi:hypothetical protein
MIIAHLYSLTPIATTPADPSTIASWASLHRFEVAAFREGESGAHV